MATQDIGPLPDRTPGGERILEHLLRENDNKGKWENAQNVRVASVLIRVTLSLEPVAGYNPAAQGQGDTPVTILYLPQLSPGIHLSASLKRRINSHQKGMLPITTHISPEGGSLVYGDSTQD